MPFGTCSQKSQSGGSPLRAKPTQPRATPLAGLNTRSIAYSAAEVSAMRQREVGASTETLVAARRAPWREIVPVTSLAEDVCHGSPSTCKRQEFEGAEILVSEWHSVVPGTSPFGVLHEYLRFLHVQCQCTDEPHTRQDWRRLFRVLRRGSGRRPPRMMHVREPVLRDDFDVAEHDEHATTLQMHDAMMNQSVANRVAANLPSSRISRSFSQDRLSKFEYT